MRSWLRLALYIAKIIIQILDVKYSLSFKILIVIISNISDKFDKVKQRKLAFYMEMRNS